MSALDAIRRKLSGYRLLVVPYCHADWAWTHSRRWHESRYVKVFEDMLDILNAQDAQGVAPDAPHAFRWYMDVYAPQLAPFLRATPDRFEELRRRVAEGRIAVCGGYANIRVNHAAGETLVRSLVYGRRTFAKLFPEADLSVHSDLVDVAAAHPQLPQILSLAGYRGYQFWRPHEALDAKGVPHHFVWEGLDGTQVLCSRGCYSGINTPRYAPADFRERWDDVVEFWWQDLLESKAEHSPVDLLWLQHGSDDSRPLRTGCQTDEPLALLGLIEEWNRRETSTLRFATPVEAFRELEAMRGRLPVVHGTLDPCDVSHKAALLGAQGLWRLRSQCARAIAVAEMLDSLAMTSDRCEGSPPAPESPWPEQLWKNLLIFSCHATQWGFQEDFDRSLALAQSTLFRARERQQSALDVLITRIAYPDNTVAVLFNPLPYARVATVPLRVSFVDSEHGGAPEAVRLVDGRGEDVPCQVAGRVSRGSTPWELDTLVQMTLPAGGWNVVCMREGAPIALAEGVSEPDRLENECLALHFDRGRLTRIVDKKPGVEWPAPGATPFGHLRAYDVDTTGQLYMGPVVGQHDAQWESCEAVESGPVRWSVRAEGSVGPHRAALETRLYRGERRVEFHATIDCVGLCGFIASHMPLPGSGRLHGDMPFCVEAKDLEQEPYVGIERQRPGSFIAQSFVDWSDGQRGMAYVSHDGDRYYVHDFEPNTIRHILINAFPWPNTGWEQHINPLTDCVGRHEFTYSIVPHEGDWQDARLWQLAGELRDKPLLAWPAAGGALPPYHSLFSVEPGNVTLSALYTEGDRVLVRVFENAGHETEATIALPFEAQDARQVDLLGKPIDAAAPRVTGRQIMLRLGPWQIATVAVGLCEPQDPH